MGRPPRITREQLLDAARRAFTANGYERATLSGIAADLGVTAAAVLRHAGSKQELFRAAMQSGGIRVAPIVEQLAHVDPASDPRPILRAIAEHFIPFAQRVIAENIVVYMHENARKSLVLPFDPDSPQSPAQHGFRIATDYFTRAIAAGVIDAPDGRAAAFLFMGSLHSYIFFHEVLKVTPVSYPLDDFVDALMALWSGGAIRAPKRPLRKSKRSGGSRDTTKQEAAATDRDSPPRRSGGGSVRVRAAAPHAEGARPLRNAGGAHRQRRVAVRRPRDEDPRR